VLSESQYAVNPMISRGGAAVAGCAPAHPLAACRSTTMAAKRAEIPGGTRTRLRAGEVANAVGGDDLKRNAGAVPDVTWMATEGAAAK
jgi:hypothetical protein